MLLVTKKNVKQIVIIGRSLANIRLVIGQTNFLTSDGPLRRKIQV